MKFRDLMFHWHLRKGYKIPLTLTGYELIVTKDYTYFQYDERKEMQDWFKNEIIGPYRLVKKHRDIDDRGWLNESYVSFSRSEDAVLFKLTFGHKPHIIQPTISQAYHL